MTEYTVSYTEVCYLV